jgi:hypothetical protein
MSILVNADAIIKTKADFYKSEHPDVIPVQETGIPEKLKNLPRWVLWGFGKRDKKGELAKEPMKCEQASPEYHKKRGIWFYGASTTNPNTWTTFDEVMRFSQLRGVAGIGICTGKLSNLECDDLGFDPEANIHLAALDYDECFQGAPDLNNLKAWAMPLVSKITPVYLELSPSKTGLKGLCFAVPPAEKTDGDSCFKYFGTDHVELYHHGRYVCITGHRVSGEDVSLQSKFYQRMRELPSKSAGASSGQKKPLLETKTVKTGHADIFEYFADHIAQKMGIPAPKFSDTEQEGGNPPSNDGATVEPNAEPAAPAAGSVDSSEANGFASSEEVMSGLNEGISDQWWKAYAGNIRTLDVVGLWQEAGLSIEPHKSKDGCFPCQCPNHAKHSDPDEIAGTVLYHHPDQFPYLHCNHTECRGVYGVKEAFAGFGKTLVDKHCSKQFRHKPSVTAPDAKAHLLTWDDLYARSLTTPMPSFWGGIQFSSLGLLSGLANSGKTEILMNMMATTIKGLDELWGHPLAPAHYLIFDRENGIRNTVKWFQKAVPEDRHKIMGEFLTFDDPDTMPSYLTMDYISDAITITKNRHLDKELVVIVDTFKGCFSSEPGYKEADESYVSKRLTELKRVAKQHGVLLMVVHHFGWNTGRATGSHAFHAVPDAVFDYHRDHTDEVGTLVRIRVRGNNDYPYKPINLIKKDGLLKVTSGIVGVEDNVLALFPRDKDKAITEKEFIVDAQMYLCWEKTDAAARRSAQKDIERYKNNNKLARVDGKGRIPHRYYRHPDLGEDKNNSLDIIKSMLVI